MNNSYKQLVAWFYDENIYHNVDMQNNGTGGLKI